MRWESPSDQQCHVGSMAGELPSSHKVGHPSGGQGSGNQLTQAQSLSPTNCGTLGTKISLLEFGFLRYKTGLSVMR